MTFWTAHNLCEVTRGTWLQPPAGDLALSGIGTDTRDDLTGRVFVALRGETHDGHDHLDDAVRAGAVLLVVESDPPHAGAARVPIILVASTRGALVDLAHAYRRILTHTRIIAITGSVGKTTTKNLLDAMLRRSLRGTCAPKSFNNEIGVPLTILRAQPDDQYLLLELGTNAPGEIERLARLARPDIAVITAIGRSHLERLGAVKDVLHEKAALLQFVRPGGCSILPVEHPALLSFTGDATVRTFGTSSAADFRLTARGTDGDGRFWFEVNGGPAFSLRLPGRHNALNAIAAIAVAREMGLDRETIATALAATDPPPMRMTTEKIGGVTYYNDAYNANPDSMLAALAAFDEIADGPGRRITVLGDMLELGDQSNALHRELGRHLADSFNHGRLDRAFFVGTFAAVVREAVAAEGWGAHVCCLESLTGNTIDHLLEQIEPGDQVLLKASRIVGLERLAKAAKTAAARGLHARVPA